MAPRISYTLGNVPIAVNYYTDRTLPGRLWSPWSPADGTPRMLRMAMTKEERAILQRRVAAVGPALSAFLRPEDDDRVALAVSDLFDSFGKLAQTENAVGRVASMIEMLVGFPAWAIEQACLNVRRKGYEVTDREGRKRIEQNFPPNDAQLCAAIEKVLAPYRVALTSGQSLLAAQMEPKAEVAAAQSIEENLADFRKKMAAGRLKVTTEDLEAMAQQRRADILERNRVEQRALRLAEYEAAGLEPPAVEEGHPVTSLAMMLHMGWSIQNIGGGRSVLVRPGMPTRGGDMVPDEMGS